MLEISYDKCFSTMFITSLFKSCLFRFIIVMIAQTAYIEISWTYNNRIGLLFFMA